MMMRPRFLSGAKRAERGPMTMWGESLSRIDSQIWWRSDSVCFECIKIIDLAKVVSKIWTS